MTDPQSEKSPPLPDPSGGKADGPNEPPRLESAPAPLPTSQNDAVRKPTVLKKSQTKRVAPATPPQERRDFFSDAMKEVLSPFAGIIERKINPMLEAIQAIPDEAERLTKMNFGMLDQPQNRSVPLSVRKSKPPERYLRPPGAMAPEAFESVCSRCGNCVEACPADAIKLDVNGLSGEGFPYIVAAEAPCVVCDDLSCMKSCPTGALKLVDRLQIKIGTAKVDHATCLRDRGENCTLCVDACPITADDAGHLAAITINAITGKVIVRKNICVGCGLCESRCPTEPRSIIVNPYTPSFDPIIA
jgi:ferredoxin-type protein NapG